MRYLYAIKDNLIGFGSIQGIPLIIDLANDDVARRVVQDSMADGQKPNAFNVHPENKEFWRLASINEETGEITALKPCLVARAIEYLGKEVVVHDVDKSEQVSEEVRS